MRLSPLDDYICSLYDEFFHSYVLPGQDVHFHYEYDRLTRALLKISYNSSRGSNHEDAKQVLSRYASCIVGDSPIPYGVTLRLQIVTAAKRIDLVEGEETMMFPEVLRSCAISYDSSQHQKFLLRLVAIRSYWFFLSIPITRVNKTHIRKLDQGLLRSVSRTGFMLPANSSEIKVPVKQTTYVHPVLLEGLFQAGK